VLPDPGYLKNQIKNANSLSDIQLKLANAGDYKSAQIHKIIEAERQVAEQKALKEGKQIMAAAEPEEYYFSRVVSTISNEEELDSFMDKIRKELLAKRAISPTLPPEQESPYLRCPHPAPYFSNHSFFLVKLEF
jgi:hypothetical protein